jgi:hypothetical protein
MMEHSVRPIGHFAFEAMNTTGSLPQLDDNSGNISAPMQNFPVLDVVEMKSLSKLQMRKALIYFEVLSQGEEAIAEESQETQDSWYSTKHVQRDDKFLNEVAKKLHFTDRQLDLIFEIGVSM